MYIVSACMAGINCRFDGANCRHEEVEKMVMDGEAIPVCPEVLGGLTIPRNRCEMVFDDNGDFQVISETGDDNTAAYVEGAVKAVEIAEIIGAKKAIMKEESPSCGVRIIYDGSFSKNKIAGMGITSKQLTDRGIQVLTEEDLK